MWLLGDGQRSQKTQLEDRSMSYLLSSMTDLTLRNSCNSSTRAAGVRHTHTHARTRVDAHTHTDSCACVSSRTSRWTLEQV